MANLEDAIVADFISKLRMMQIADRNKVKLKTLVNLVLQLPDDAGSDGLAAMNRSLNDVLTKLAHVQQTSIEHAQEIHTLKEQNAKLLRVTHELSKESTELKDGNEILREELDGVNQYLRVNNLEIHGLPENVDDSVETVEEMILESLNGLAPEQPVNSHDIHEFHT